MNALDWAIIIIYLIGMIGLSVYLGRGQSSEEDYFVGGRKLSWWSVGMSGIFWMWWNLFGFLVTVCVSFLVGLFSRSPRPVDISRYVLRGSERIKAERRWISTYMTLFFYFCLMLIFLLLI